MGIVKQLAPHVADLIAAGEVVERPASVIKELMENAVDAGAAHITAEIRNGGIDLIRVIDDGCGMSREDAQACFIRHATSKIAEEEDLHAILTLGFRGEALAAISAVARVELITRTADDEVGTCVRLSGGTIDAVEDIGCPVGTTITVEKIFYNTPARMKFLKKNATEASYCAAAADKVALAHPEVAVRFVKDGRNAMRTPGDGKLYSAVYGVCGRDFANSLIPVEQKEVLSLSGPRVAVWGFVTRPELSLSTRSSQYFILNGRFIRSRTLGAALEEAYRGSIMTGKYPGCVLQAAIDPGYVDVNVHPAKTEVKFADEREAFEAVYTAVKNALSASLRPTFSAPHTGKEEEVPAPPAPREAERQPAAAEPERPAEPAFSPPSRTEQESFAAELMRAVPPAYAAQPPRYAASADISAEDFDSTPAQPIPAPRETGGQMADGTIAEQAPQETDAAPETEEFRIVGELYHSYIVVELPDEILYIDKHAAHERILYNRLRENAGGAAPQLLMEPVVLPLASEDLELISEHTEAFRQAGLEIEDFGGGSLIVREIPQYIDASETADLVADILGRVRTGEPDSFYDDILHSIACKAAIKAGWHTTEGEREALVRDVLSLKDVRYCPHGRPVALVTSRREFEKGFRRVL